MTEPRRQIKVAEHPHKARTWTAYPWSFFVAMAASLLLFFSFQAVFPTFPLFIVTLGGTSADNGLMTWTFALAALLTRPVAGSLADRWGRKPVLVLGAVLFGSGPLLYTFAPTVSLLLVMRAVHGIGLAFFSTAYQAFAADLLPEGHYGEGMGLASVAPSLAMVLAPLLGEWLVGALDFGPSFAIFSAIGGLGALAVVIVPGTRRRQENPLSDPAEQDGLRKALRQPGVRAGALAMAFLGVPFGTFLTFVPLLAGERGLGGTGLVFAAYALASALTRPLAGRVADRWGTYKMALVGLAVVGASALGLTWADSRWTLLGVVTIFGIGGGAAGAALDACVQSSVGHSLRGSAAAIQYTAFDLLVGFGSLLLGLLAGAAGYGTMYAVVGGITLLGALALTWSRFAAGCPRE